ncbi:unnamed protein product [Symbiodinium sp. CCMP2592]|nr:unnamed protein product [Symbiodinium sp. CCMP2592]
MALQMLCGLLLLCASGMSAMRATEDDLDADLLDDGISTVPWATLDEKSRADLLQQGFKNNACYCKKVKSEAECPSEEEGDPRWYHKDKGDEKNNLCCKIANTGFFTYVGWSYTKMDGGLSLCESEIRPVPATSCCWLDGLVANPVGIRVSRVSTDLEVDLHAYSQKTPVVHKSGFNFRIEDITGGRDYNSAVDVYDVQKFVEYNYEAGRFDKLQCRKTLFREDRGYCVVREKAATACCCHKASLLEATRCLNAPKAPKQQTVIVMPQSQDRRQLTGMPKQTYMEEDNMPKTLSSVDPEAEDDFDTYDDETEMVWTWSRVQAQKQWTSHCSKNLTSGACIEMNYTRVCPYGKGLYEKKLYTGSTYREKPRPKDVHSNLLEWVAPMTYECPRGDKFLGGLKDGKAKLEFMQGESLSFHGLLSAKRKEMETELEESLQHTKRISEVLDKASSLEEFETHGGPGEYLRDAVTKAGDAVGIGYRVFILNRLAHAGGLRGDFWHRAGLALAPAVAEMRGDLLGLAANAFTAAGEIPRPLAEAISRRVLAEADLADVPVDSLTLLFHSSRELTSTAAWAVEQHLPERLSEMNDHDAALFLSSVGVSKGPAKRPEQLKALGRSLTTAPGLTGPALAQLAQAFARLRSRDEGVLLPLRDLVMAKARRGARSQQLPPQSLGMVSNAFARMSFLESRTSVTSEWWVKAKTPASTPPEEGGDPPGTGCSRRGCQQASRAERIRAVRLDSHDSEGHAEGLSVPANLASCSPQSLAIAMNAYSKFVPDLKRAGMLTRVEVWFSQAAQQVVDGAKNYQVQNLVNVLAAFAQLGLRDLALLSTATKELLLRKDQWNSQDVSNLASALARLEYWDGKIFSALGSAAKLCTELGEVASLLNSLAHFLKQPLPADISAAVEPSFDAVRLSEESLARGDIFQMALLLNSLSKVRPASPATATLIRGLEARCHPHFVPAGAVVSLSLGAFARLLCLPPWGLQEAAKRSAEAKAHHSLALPNGVGLLSALVRLDALRTPMRPWFNRILASFSALLASSSVAGWNARSLPTALGALCMLSGCSSSKEGDICITHWSAVTTSLWVLANKTRIPTARLPALKIPGYGFKFLSQAPVGIRSFAPEDASM